MNEADETGRTALLWAAWRGRADVVRLLLARKGVEVNKSAADGATALMSASQQGHVEVVQLLLARQDVKVSQSDSDGFTALLVASQKGHVEAFFPARAPGRRGEQDRAERGHGADDRVAHRPT